MTPPCLASFKKSCSAFSRRSISAISVFASNELSFKPGESGGSSGSTRAAGAGGFFFRSGVPRVEEERLEFSEDFFRDDFEVDFALLLLVPWDVRRMDRLVFPPVGGLLRMPLAFRFGLGLAVGTRMRSRATSSWRRRSAEALRRVVFPAGAFFLADDLVVRRFAKRVRARPSTEDPTEDPAEE